ncbi:MAG: twin-arginine translocase TatA/TatE family subunit [Pirellulaceae bacterium]|nr:twin-arginine translocase TatA/TatE family subunit [Pirellulaceae bacterium]
MNQQLLDHMDNALTHLNPLGFIFGGMGMMEVMVIGGIAVMLFGKNLPSVARKFGKTYREFRKGLSEFQSQVRVDDYVNDVYSDIDDDSSNTSSSASGADDWSAEDFDDYSPPSAPMFEPPPSEPSEAAESAEEAD